MEILKTNRLGQSIRGIQILAEVNLTLLPGETLIIVGPNGAGKSTLLSRLANEMPDENDQIYFKEIPLKAWMLKDLSLHKAKFSQQNNANIPMRVKEIVLMGRYPYFDSRPGKKDLSITEAAMRQTEVFELSDRNYNTLSGGEKQRVHLARVLAQLQNDLKNKVAFFDEPLNNLDVKHQYQIMEIIRNFTQTGNAAIVVLHDLNIAAQFGDKILLLKKGRIIAQGDSHEVFSSENIESAYNFPCTLFLNPITRKPMIVFNRMGINNEIQPVTNSEKTEKTEKTEAHRSNQSY